MPGSKLNCWEFTNCGRGPGAELVCPAAAEAGADGVNGGRSCWTIAGTSCGGRLQGTFAAKIETCLKCEFCQQVLAEEQRAPGAKRRKR